MRLRAPQTQTLAKKRRAALTKVLEKLDWPLLWGEGQPECIVIANGLFAYAIVPARVDWSWNIIKFFGCESVKYGGPNDEVMNAHPLAGQGIECGEFYILRNSKWKRELEEINCCHEQYNSNNWKKIRHYILVLREHVLECLAKAYTVKLTNESRVNLVNILLDQAKEISFWNEGT